MSTSLGITLLSSFQSSLSVLLTLSYGLVAAKYKLLSPAASSQVARLCIQLFLPALLFTSLGSELGSSDSDFSKIWPLLIWSLTYPTLCLSLTYPLVRYLHFPTWCLPAAAFNNATSLPLLLIQALASTGALDRIVGSDSSQSQNLQRLRNYLLMNAMVSNALTFTIGPRLLRLSHSPKSTSMTLDEESLRDARARTDDATRFSLADSSDERQPLLARHPISSSNSIQSNFSRFRASFHSLECLLNPPLVAVVLAISVGRTEILRRIFFETPERGGILNAWLTKSMENVGGVFSTVQLFVVGSKLYEGLMATPSEKTAIPDSEPSFDIPQNSKLTLVPFLWLVFLRFLLMPTLATSAVYILLSRTSLLGQDPTLWFAIAIVATGPPASRIAALVDLSGLSEKAQHSVARLLAGFYLITPLISFPIVAAIVVCERFL
ncbi:hypothetical protein SISNIDRAFT_456162 [Sistotremastrum niveocremeum HHB9708]|uniref:Auxin efflux carrier n=1 Tax=Sistotremastrum niveocremeum HHB9708 TaxID=1314777 RepID=A0A164T0L4_9AGAM|nr:hypothetical protein SISNIDRAFT_456162 [Sistotremastrum niveocremeum HHB9708]